MRRSALLSSLVLITFVAACGFGGNRQAEIEFPRVLELSNASQHEIVLTAVSSTSDATATFFLSGGRLPPGASRSWRIQLDAYEDILSGNFVLDGICGDIDPWEKPGSELRTNMVEREDLGTVIVAIRSCES